MSHGGKVKRYMLLSAGACAGLALAGCANGDDGASDATSSSTPPSSTFASPSSAALGEVDVRTCQSFVATGGDAYGWLKDLQTTGTVTSDLSTPGYLDAYQLGGMASVFVSEVESPQLKTAMQNIVRDGEALRTGIDNGGGSVPATSLVNALTDAARVCEAGGFTIDWN
jgi:hypothetical protein